MQLGCMENQVHDIAELKERIYVLYRDVKGEMNQGGRE
jgi:hypothetical protein